MLQQQLVLSSHATRSTAAVFTSAYPHSTTIDVTTREAVIRKEMDDLHVKISAVEACLKSKAGSSSISVHAAAAAAAVATTHQEQQGRGDSSLYYRYSEYVQMYEEESVTKVELKDLLISLQKERTAALMALTPLRTTKSDFRTVQLKHGSKSSRKESLLKEDITLNCLRLLAIESFSEPFLLEDFTICFKDGKGGLRPLTANILARLVLTSSKPVVKLGGNRGYKLGDKPGDMADSLIFHIKSDCKGFDEFTLKEALKYASRGRPTSNPLESDRSAAAFPPANFDDKDPVIADILRHAVSDITCKIPLYGPIYSDQNEASARELIGPVLVAAVRIAGYIMTTAAGTKAPTSSSITIVNKKTVRGSRGKGSVDFDMEYRGFNVVVITEAKEDDIAKGLTQNIAQLVAGREDYLFERAGGVDLENDESSEFAAALEPVISDVPSYGVVVNSAWYWVFTRYLKGEVTCSNGFTIPLQTDSSTQEAGVLHRDVLLVVRTLVEILINQTTSVDKNEYTSKGEY